jgi:AcrR family transcriptional regulator
VPVQARSRQKVAAILAAARDLLVESGMGSFGIEALAGRAGVSVGTIYQFFTTKEAILNELARQSLQSARWWLEEQGSPAVLGQEWAARVDLLVRRMAEAWAADASAQVIWDPAWSTAEMRHAAEAFDAELVAVVDAILAAAGVPRRRRAIMAEVVVQSLGAVLDRWSKGGATDPAVPKELRALVMSYVNEARRR